MDIQLRKMLEERYSVYLQSNYPNTVFNERGFECGPGWLELLVMFAEKLETLSIRTDQVRILQIKEKWWVLRIYVEVPGYVDEEIEDFIDMLKVKSAGICEACGKPKLEEADGHACNPAHITLEYQRAQYLKRLTPPDHSKH